MSESTTRTAELRQVRLKAGMYGRCLECYRDIADRRLRLQGFAMRCQACEQRRAAPRPALSVLQRLSGITVNRSLLSIVLSD